MTESQVVKGFRLRPRAYQGKLGHGPGSELLALFAELHATPPNKGCNCEEVARQMNKWGVAGCRERRNTIIGMIEDNAGRWTWGQLIWNHVKVGVSALANGIAPSLGAIVDEAVRRAEVKEGEKKNISRSHAGVADRSTVINLLGRGFCRGLGDAITWAWIAEGAEPRLTFAAAGGVKVLLEMLGQRVVASNVPTGLDVQECHRREMREHFRRPRCEVWREVLGIKGEPKRPPVNIPRQPVANRIAIAPECEWAARTWPRHLWHQLAQRLSENGYDLLWVLKAHRWAFDECARQIATCSLLIGNDSMPAHMAGTLGLPALVLFGLTRPPVLAHYSSVTAIDLGPRIDAIPVNVVFDRAVQLMGVVHV